MALPSSNRSIGEKAITTLPANRSLIIADSRFRVDNPADEPYNFTCNLGGTGIYAKEIYYLKLIWNQPIFAHNNLSSELRFQMFGNTSITYIVYATPFLMYTAYDGNPDGTSLLPPQLYSYASNMELALNGDIRTYPLNTTLINGDGIMRDPFGAVVNMRFRYSPVKGFCIYPEQNFAAYPDGYSIKLLPCNYIANAHYVHGFGVFDPAIDPRDYTPYNFFTAAYWSDATPNLLPMRYIVIQSPELNKDRRMISFHNGNFANFINELSIFSLNPARTGVFHEVSTGDDATVVSLRDDYTPQRFRISILDEFGKQIQCDDPVRNMLNSEGIPLDIMNSFLFGPLTNRGSPTITNYLTFGFVGISGTGGSTQKSVSTLNDKLHPPPIGMATPARLICRLSISSTPDPGFPAKWSPISRDFTSAPSGNTNPSEIGFIALNENVDYFSTPALGKASVWKWWPSANSNPGIQLYLQWQFNNVPAGLSPADTTTYIMMMDATTNAVIGIDYMGISKTTLRVPDADGFFSLNPAVGASWQWNPDYILPPLSSSFVRVVFSFRCIMQVQTKNPQEFIDFYPALETIPPYFNIFNYVNEPNVQTEYLPPAVSSYVFGNPQASALCEELIHEIAAINEYN